MPTVPASGAARRRALKRYVWNARHRCLATCAVGVEDLLAAEVAALPAADGLVPRTGAVAFEAPFDTLLSALLRLRVAESLRVYVAEHLPAVTFPMLHDHLTRVRWWWWLPERVALTVRVKSSKSRLRDSQGLERSLRKALAAQGIATDDAAAPPLTLHLNVHRDRAAVSLDLAGPMHRRHPGKWVSRTTIRETTAAALCRVAGFTTDLGPAATGLEARRYDLVLDPFCGSGTICAEAIELEAGTAAGRERSVPFEASPAFKPERMAHARRLCGAADPSAVSTRHRNPTATSEHRGSPRTTYLASDADPDAVAVARRNLSALGLERRVALEVASAQALDLAAIARAHSAECRLLLSNPPYGKRAEALDAGPAELLRGLLATAPGWRFALLYPHVDHLVSIPGVEVEDVRRVTTSGLPNAMIVGRVAARVGSDAVP
jgi:23S rRNA G2445 N2-methylase RlmL